MPAHRGFAKPFRPWWKKVNTGFSKPYRNWNIPPRVYAPGFQKPFKPWWKGPDLPSQIVNSQQFASQPSQDFGSQFYEVADPYFDLKMKNWKANNDIANKYALAFTNHKLHGQQRIERNLVRREYKRWHQWKIRKHYNDPKHIAYRKHLKFTRLAGRYYPKPPRYYTYS